MRHVVIVDGPLAFRMRRLEAARANDIGVEVLTLPLLAARLAGGFCRLVDREHLAPAIGAALAAGDTSPRLSDLGLIQRRVRAALPAGAMLPQDLRAVALARFVARAIATRCCSPQYGLR
jgi:hypothetical protein